MEKSRASFLSKVLLITALGLLLTFFIANFVTPALLRYLIYTVPSFEIIIYAVMIVEVLVVIAINAAINKISTGIAYALFFFYSFLNGITIGTLLLVYTSGTALIAFLAAGITFSAAGVFGFVTKVDLSPLRKFFLIGLIGLVAIGVLGFFFNFSSFDFIISVFAIILFIGITAYDMQKIKLIHNNSYAMNRESASKYAIIGALTLYLDFINLFIRFLRILGKKK